MSAFCIKPGNVLLLTSGAVKLCDFSVSTQLARSLASTYVGTAAYMAVCNASIIDIMKMILDSYFYCEAGEAPRRGLQRIR